MRLSFSRGTSRFFFFFFFFFTCGFKFQVKLFGADQDWRGQNVLGIIDQNKQSLGGSCSYLSHNRAIYTRENKTRLT